MGPSLPDLERQRTQLYGELADSGDVRRGSISATWRRCGKPNCACAQPDHPGHGPRHLWTHSVAGRTEGRQLAAGAELEKVSREVAGYQRFKAIVGEIVEVNEAICEARPVSPLAGEPPAAAGAEKGGSARASGRTSPAR